MQKGFVPAVALTALWLLVPGASRAVETERNGFYLRPVGTYGGVAASTEWVHVGDGLGGGLSAGYNFARGWIGGIEGGVTYTRYAAGQTVPPPLSGKIVPDRMEVIDIFFGGVVGGSLGPVDLYGTLGFDLPVTRLGGWDPYLGVKVGGGIDVWIVDRLALGVTGNFVWGYSLGDAYNIPYRYPCCYPTYSPYYDPYAFDLDSMSRYTVQFGPKFKF